MKKAVVVIPALNEAQNIGNIVCGIRHDFPDMDIVVVDDGSTDNTGEIARRAGAVVLSHVNPMGYGVALQTGYKYAKQQGRYDFIVQLDADGQHNYSDIPKLLKPVAGGEADLAIGSRFIDQHKNGYRVPKARMLGIILFRMLVTFFAKKRILDITSGYQCFNQKVLDKYIQDDMPYYYPDSDVLILMVKGGVRVLEIPAMNGNNQGRSMHKGVRNQLYYVITMFLSILVIILKDMGKKRWLQNLLFFL